MISRASDVLDCRRGGGAMCLHIVLIPGWMRLHWPADLSSQRHGPLDSFTLIQGGYVTRASGGYSLPMLCDKPIFLTSTSRIRADL